jgi:hypothetical protein
MDTNEDLELLRLRAMAKLKLQAGQRPKPKDTIDQSLPPIAESELTFLGSPALGHVAAKVFPRTAAAEENRRGDIAQGAGAFNDVESLPGRSISSLVDLLPGSDESYMEGLGRTQARPKEGLGKVSQFVENAVRSPATIPAIATGGIASALIPEIAAGSGALETAIQAGRIGAAGGLGAATTTQADNLAGGRDFDPNQAVHEVAINTAIPMLGAALGPKLKEAGLKIYDSALKPSKALILKKGLDPEQILQQGYGGGFGSGLNALEKRLSDLDEGVTNEVLAANPSTSLEGVPDKDPIDLYSALKDVIANKKNEVMAGEHAGLANELEAAGKQWQSDLDNRLTTVDPATALKYQRGVGKWGYWDRNINPGEVPAKARLANDYYSELGNKLDEVLPNIGPMRKEQSQLIPMRQALQEAEARTSKNHTISLTDMFSGLGAMIGLNSHGPKGALIPLVGGAINRASKSPQVGTALYKAGEGLATKSLARDAIKRAILNNAYTPEEDNQ